MAYHPFRHLGLKFLSIALAVLIWLLVADQRAVERTVRAPLEFHNVPEGLELVNDPPETVEVRVRGTSSVLARLLPSEVVGVLNLASARPGTRLFHLLTDEVRVPYGVQVAQVTPATIPLSFERSGLAHRAGRARGRGRSGAGLCGRAHHVGSGGGGSGRPGQPAGRSEERDDRARLDRQGHASGPRHGHHWRRQRQPAPAPAGQRHGHRGDRAGGGGARAGRGAGADDERAGGPERDA